jgi:CheY-like chemotaxis protein
MLPIVIVDDSLEDALLAQRIVGLCKIQNPVVLLRSGQACIDYFRGVKPYEKRSVPCILLLDMIMSPVNGLGVLRRLREIPAAKGSMVVMLSGLADLKMIHEGYQLGANTFLVKPLLAEDIMQMVRAIPRLAINKVPQGYELFLAPPVASGGADQGETPSFPNLV